MFSRLLSRGTPKPDLYNKFQSYTPKIDYIYKLRELMIKYKANTNIYVILLAFMNRYYIITSEINFTHPVLINNYNQSEVYTRIDTDETDIGRSIPFSVKYNSSLGEIMLHYYDYESNRPQIGGLQRKTYYEKFSDFISCLNTDFNENVLDSRCTEFEGDKRNCDEPPWMICNGLVPILGKYQSRYIITPSYTGNLAHLLLSTNKKKILSLIETIHTRLEDIIDNAYETHKILPFYYSSMFSYRLTPTMNMFTIFYKRNGKNNDNDFDLFFGGKLVKLNLRGEYMYEKTKLKELKRLDIILLLYYFYYTFQEKQQEQLSEDLKSFLNTDSEYEELYRVYDKFKTNYKNFLR